MNPSNRFRNRVIKNKANSKTNVGKVSGSELPDSIISLDTDERDLYHYTPLQKAVFSLRPLLLIPGIILSWSCVLVQHSIINKKGVRDGWTSELIARRYLLWLDFICICPATAKTFADVFSISRHKWRKRFRLTGSNVPLVDVVVVCCKEPLDVILDTVRAAANIDYPNRRFRLLVSDDGGQAEVEKGVQEIQHMYPDRSIFYSARVRTKENSHKAANLNHAFRFFSGLPGGSAPFVAGIDADMIVQKPWLRAQLPAFIHDSKLAFTCPPPRFYNVPINDPLSQSLLAFQRVEELLKDAGGFPWVTGSGWVMRREAIDSIGGFPEESITEDLLCSNRLLGQGWRGTYIMETLQWGLVPDSYHAHVKQRNRWATGALQTGILMRMCVWGRHAQHMNLLQRILGGIHPLYSSFATLPVVVMLCSLFLHGRGWPSVVYTEPDELKYLIRLNAMTTILHSLQQGLYSILVDFPATMRLHVATDHLAFFNAYDQWRTFILPTWLGGIPNSFSAKFLATGSIIDELHERNPELRAPLPRRLWATMVGDAAIIPSLMAFYYMYLMTMRGIEAYQIYQVDTDGYFIYILTHVLTVPLTWPFRILALLRPLYVTLFPPSELPRADLLVYDEDGIPTPRESARTVKWTGLGLGTELLWFVNLIYCSVMLVWSLY